MSRASKSIDIVPVLFPSGGILIGAWIIDIDLDFVALVIERMNFERVVRVLRTEFPDVQMAGSR